MYQGSSLSGSNYDGWSYENSGRDISTLNKLQHKYWITKTAVARKLGKDEDEHIVSSDSELDAKLELFSSIQSTTQDLQRLVEIYQDRLCNLSYEENALGRFLKDYGKTDKTKAGKMMIAVGKTMSYSGQQRLSIRSPLLRLFHEVETFRIRAIEDTMWTLEVMEKHRTAYRGSLSWMKKISKELDPDTYKRLDKFRKVQNHVKDSKKNFDKSKLDCLQKIDLLAASRCNMFSQALILYQDALISFWEKTSKAMTLVSESFKGYQHYDFFYTKELVEVKDEPKSTIKCSKDSENNEEETSLLLNIDTEESRNFDSLPSNTFETDNKSKVESQKFESENAVLLNEIMNGSSSYSENDFSVEWNSLFGDNLSNDDFNAFQSADKQPQETDELIFPSQLFELNQSSYNFTKQDNIQEMQSDESIKKSEWFDLFADLDPLSNPDAIGRSKEEKDKNIYS